ncbi:MAG TPA: hypothetical protein VHD60_04060 [Candidatus Saccharimonadales bacterium]|nr:hypothetical protein [Candidatus Saccharimonadales bacterium]
MFHHKRAHPDNEERPPTLDSLKAEYARARSVFRAIKVGCVAVPPAAVLSAYESDSAWSLGVGGAAVALIAATAIRQEFRTTALNNRINEEIYIEERSDSVFLTPEMRQLDDELERSMGFGA